ncbi:MAG: hypothetical protein ACM3PV_07385 [Betaproteobacteria bacterium]
MSGPLNLARRPLRNERLPTLLLAVALAVLVLLTARHAVLASQLRQGGARDVEGEVVALDREVERLRAESADLQRTPAPRPKIEEWTAVKELVDRRVFSWTGLFGALEAALPPRVRLVSVAPATGQGPMLLSLVAEGRDVDDAIALLKALQASASFEGAFLDGVGESASGVRISCTVRYLGARRTPTRGAS